MSARDYVLNGISLVPVTRRHDLPEDFLVSYLDATDRERFDRYHSITCRLQHSPRLWMHTATIDGDTHRRFLDWYAQTQRLPAWFLHIPAGPAPVQGGLESTAYSADMARIDESNFRQVLRALDTLPKGVVCVLLERLQQHAGLFAEFLIWVLTNPTLTVIVCTFEQEAPPEIARRFARFELRAPVANPAGNQEVAPA